jgi:hypothetical protein
MLKLIFNKKCFSQTFLIVLIKNIAKTFLIILTKNIAKTFFIKQLIKKSFAIFFNYFNRKYCETIFY